MFPTYIISIIYWQHLTSKCAVNYCNYAKKSMIFMYAIINMALS